MHINHLEYNHFDNFFFEDVDGLAGSNQSLANPDKADFQLVHLQTQFDTDANAADRTVLLTVLQNTIPFTFAASPVIQTASKTWFYHFSLGINNYTHASGKRIFVPLPDRLRLNGSALITLVALDKQAGDRFTNTRTVRNLWQSVP